MVNEIAKEMAMILAPMGRELLGIHVWGEHNALADALSRQAQGAPLPPLLASVPRVEPGPRGRTAWRYLGQDMPRTTA